MAEPAILEIRSEENGDSVVRLSFEPDTEDPDLATFDVRLTADGLECERTVSTTQDGNTLGRFAASLAEDWRGWEGTRTWESLWRDLRVEATHLGRAVELVFVLRPEDREDAWEVRLPILLTPGESLRRVASAAASLQP